MYKRIYLSHIGGFLLIPFCSVISHTILPIPPTVILFCFSVIFILSIVENNDYKICSVNRVSAYPIILSFYLLFTQIMLGVELRAIISPFLAPLYFVITLLYLNYLSEERIERLVIFFIYISLFVFVIECLWRFSHPKLPEGMEEVIIEGHSRWIYWFKGPGLMYVETNGLAIHLIIVYFFTLWWSSLKKKKMMYVKVCYIVLIFLTFSRAAIISVPIGWIYFYYYSKLSFNNKFIISIISILSLLIIFPFVISVLQSDPSSAEKFSVFVKIWEYLKHIDLFSLIYGIGNYNSKVVFGTYAHNYLLVFLIEMGLVGLILMLIQFISFIKESRGEFLFVFVPFFVQIMSSTIIFIPHLYMVAAIMVYYAKLNAIFKSTDNLYIERIK